MVLIDDGNQDSSPEDDSSSSEDERGHNGFHVILDDQEVEETFMAVKRNADGQALPKNTRTGPFDPMPEENLLNPARQPQKKGSSQKKTGAGKKKRSKKATNRRKTLQMEPQPKYDVVSALTNASSGLTFGPLYQGDASSPRKELEQIFGKGKLKVECLESGKSSSATKGRKEEKCLAVALV